MRPKLSRILEVMSAAVQILQYLGVPIATLLALVAGITAQWRSYDPSTSLLVALFVIYAVLGSITSVIYIYDRAGEQRRRIEAENAEIHYQLAPAFAVLIRDPSNESAEYQLRFRLINNSQYPVRYYMISTKVTIEDVVNPDGRGNYVPGVLPAGAATEVRCNSYARGKLNTSGINRGVLDINFRYGRATVGLTFESNRKYTLKCVLPTKEETEKENPLVIPISMVVKHEQDDLLVVVPQGRAEDMSANS